MTDLPLHRLLQKQIERARTPDGEIETDVLFGLISSAYEETDQDRRRSERSIALMIEEVDQVNAGLETLVAQRTSELKDVGLQLQATIANVDQGIVMTNADGCVVIFNQKFLEFTGLTEMECAVAPRFSTLVDRMLARGEFDPMGEPFKDWVRQHGRNPGLFAFERTRPDGTVLHVQTRSLPDGGEVRTMSDITAIVRRSKELDATKRILELTLENVSQGILKIDPERRIVVFNSRAVELLGLPEGFLECGQTLQSLLNYQIDSGEFANMDQSFIDFIRSGGIADMPQVYERQRPNGVILEIRTLRLPDGAAVRTYTDITEMRNRERALERAQEEYRGLFENSIVGIYRSGIDGQQLRANPALVRMNGYENEAEMVSSVSDIANQWYVDPRRRDEFVTALHREGRISDFVSEVYRHNTREKFWVSEAAWLVRDETGTPVCYEGMVIDATARKKAENEIAHIALHDMLTNLPNRTLFLDTLKSALIENRRGHDIAVLCLDLDRFKDVNDTLGHDCGDILLRLASRRLARAIPVGGMAARFGGDEFAALIPDVRDRDVVMHLARTIVESLSRPYRVRGHRVYVGASIGIAISPSDGTDAHDLLKKADIALYRVKRDGRGTYTFFDEGMTAAILARREIEAELRRAIAHDEFRLFYQPIMDLESDQPNGYEALIRWEHPTKGLLSPAYFIDIAEECGLITQIGEIVLRQACACLARHDDHASVSVNLSPVQFRNHQLAVSVISALANSGLPPTRLVLEITESVLLADDSRTVDVLRQLRSLGVRIALDDFGIGHSSLSYLQKFPFDRIKIDKSFVQNGEDGLMNTAIRRAILGLGNDLDIEIVVEGVETAEQRDMLVYEGCRLVQGYLYGKPQPEGIVFARSAKAERKTASPLQIAV
ncbi:MAG: GGDEF domain-containing protein [Rhizobiales bacterium PAR1]|nr:MAG: GGDEF domain-containing protein [Rhizobiales bacterium PAR1]